MRLYRSLGAEQYLKKKIVLVHFIRNNKLQSSTPINIKGTKVSPYTETKILEVLIDSKLYYKNHIKRISYKKLKTVLTLKHIQILTLSSAH